MKPLKVIVGKAPWDTKVFVDDIDITEKLSLFGIDIKLRVDKIPEVILHTHNLPIEYALDVEGVKVVDYKLVDVTKFGDDSRKYDIHKGDDIEQKEL